MQNKTIKNSKFSVNDLILFCVYSVGLNNEKCSFERLVKECFTLFPEILSFQRYPIWPDSRKIDRPLRVLRKEKLIIGDPQTMFLLTKEGEKKAVDLDRVLKQGKLL